MFARQPPVHEQHVRILVPRAAGWHSSQRKIDARVIKGILASPSCCSHPRRFYSFMGIGFTSGLSCIM
jgi:hypothetical protein